MYGQYNNVRLVGITATVPENVIRNEDLADIFDEKSVRKQIKTTGIYERRCALDGQTASDLSYLAAERLLDGLGWERDSVKLLIYVTPHPLFASPSTSFYMQRKLGIGTDCLVFDMNLACSGFVIGIETAGAFLQGCPEGTRAILMVGAAPNSCLDGKPDTASLFGDGGGAAALETRKGYHTFFSQYSDGTQMQYLFRYPGKRSHMNGMGLFQFTINEVVESINDFFQHYGMDKGDIDYYFLHQAQKYMFDKLIDFCDLPEDRCPVSFDRFGNTAAVSIPITMSRHVESLDYSGKKKIFMCGFGGGLSWGNIMLETKDILVLPLEESNAKLEMDAELCEDKEDV